MAKPIIMMGEENKKCVFFLIGH